MMLFQTKATKNATPIERTAPQVTTAVTSCHLIRNNLNLSDIPRLVAPPAGIENKPGKHQGDWQRD